MYSLLYLAGLSCQASCSTACSPSRPHPMGLVSLPVAIEGYREFSPVSRKPTNHAAYSAPRRCVWCIAHLRAILALRASQYRPCLRQQAVRYRKSTLPVHVRCLPSTPRYALSTSPVHSQYVLGTSSALRFVARKFSGSSCHVRKHGGSPEAIGQAPPRTAA